MKPPQQIGSPGQADSSCASPEAIQSHYDVGDNFYRIWLDPTLTYTSALREPSDDLDAAQVRKLEYHIDQARAPGKRRVLDIGCGWGSLLERMVTRHGVERAVGLTLSEAQSAFIAARGIPNIEVRLESWVDHRPAERYDAIISIGAFEHFARPEHSSAQRIEAYRHFFSRCREMIEPGGHLSLQTIAYAIGAYSKSAVTDIFPESDLPRLEQIAAACVRTFEIVRLRNDREDYAWTCQNWLDRLQQRRGDAVMAVGEQIVERYERYLAGAIRAFNANVYHLYRITLRRFG